MLEGGGKAPPFSRDVPTIRRSDAQMFRHLGFSTPKFTATASDLCRAHANSREAKAQGRRAKAQDRIAKTAELKPIAAELKPKTAELKQLRCVLCYVPCCVALRVALRVPLRVDTPKTLQEYINRCSNLVQHRPNMAPKWLLGVPWAALGHLWEVLGDCRLHVCTPFGSNNNKFRSRNLR